MCSDVESVMNSITEEEEFFAKSISGLLSFASSTKCSKLLDITWDSHSDEFMS